MKSNFPINYDDVIAAIETWNPTSADWQRLRAWCGLKADLDHNARAHISWLRRKAAKNAGLANTHLKLHRIVKILAEV